MVGELNDPFRWAGDITGTIQFSFLLFLMGVSDDDPAVPVATTTLTGELEALCLVMFGSLFADSEPSSIGQSCELNGDALANKVDANSVSESSSSSSSLDEAPVWQC
eukprot:GILK01027003.1.p2 GENE.GILK01027003.1~~GILK01027003.1.p2  ORF type:complete len:107 (-),score=7.49 GILK01027003.1:43-363(-)